MNLFRLIPASFYSAAAYSHMRQNKNFGLGYAFLMVVLTTLVVTLYFTQLIHRELFTARESRPSFMEEMVTQIAAQMPPATMMDGTLVTDKAEITVIYVSGTAFGKTFDNVPLATVDTTGQTTHDTMNTPVLITSKDVIIDKNDKKEIRSLTEFFDEQRGPLIINKAVAQSMAQEVLAGIMDNLATIYLILGTIFWLFAMVYIFVMRLIMLLLLGLVGIAYAGIQKVELSYASAVGLAALSYTPVLLLDAVLFMLRGDSPSTLTLFAAGCVTLIAAITASNPEKPPEQQA